MVLEPGKFTVLHCFDTQHIELFHHLDSLISLILFLDSAFHCITVLTMMNGEQQQPKVSADPNNHGAFHMFHFVMQCFALPFAQNTNIDCTFEYWPPRHSPRMQLRM